jgi:hypothetical protein
VKNEAKRGLIKGICEGRANKIEYSESGLIKPRENENDTKYNNANP